MGRVCCVIGHQTIQITEKIKQSIQEILYTLIEEDFDTFLFGGPGRFDELCWESVSLLKNKVSNIRRIYVRSSFPEISQEYRDYLLLSYEDTYFPKRILNAGKLSHLIRNQIMIDQSEVVLLYYDTSYQPKNHKNSGTALAYQYAVKKHKRIINLLD